MCWSTERRGESARERSHGMRSGFLIHASCASETAPLLKVRSEREKDIHIYSRTAGIFSATRRWYRRWLPVGNEMAREARRVARGAHAERCESAANADSVRARSQFRPGKRIESAPDFYERPTRCWRVASVVPPWFTPSKRCALPSLVSPCPRLPSFMHLPAFHLPFAGLAHSFVRSRAHRPASH